MEPVTIAAFLGACLAKAGEKFSEKTIETLFENKTELAEKFTHLFKDDIITLGLNDATTAAEAQQALAAAPPQTIEQVQKKFDANAELIKELRAQLPNDSGQTINIAKNVAAQGNVRIENQTNNFS